MKVGSGESHPAAPKPGDARGLPSPRRPAAGLPASLFFSSPRFRSLLPTIVISLFFFYTLVAQSAQSAFAQAPRILRLDSSDSTFAQLSADVEDARRRLARANGSEEAFGALTIYEYETRTDDTLLTLAARFGLPYGTLATINRLGDVDSLVPGMILLVPGVPGLFIPEEPESDLELLMTASRDLAEARELVIRAGKNAVKNTGKNAGKFRFFPGLDYTPTERAFFLNIAFRFPLPTARLTSGFGLRRNPVSGTLKRHDGLDLAAPAGTEVYATRDGTVTATGEDPVYGKFVRIAHEGGWESLYGHLSVVLADLRKDLRSGTIIGRVGSTGQSTGPHLHFELRRGGKALDPASLLTRVIQQ